MLVCGPSLPAFAQAPATGAAAGSTVVITAERTPQRLQDVDADVVVLTRDDIERQGYGDLADLLHASGAVELTRNGGPGAATSLYLRGTNTEHTLLMVDGVRIESQAIAGGPPWENIPLSQIDRIEIVKGPASALYGSDAIGGVVQIFTRRGHGRPTLDLGVAAGSLATLRTDAAVQGSAGAFDYAVAVATERSHGFRLVPDPNDPSGNYNPDRAGSHKHSWSARLGLQADARDRVELIGLGSHLATEFNAYSATALGQQTEDEAAGTLAWQRHWSADLNTRLSLAQSLGHLDDRTDIYATRTRIRTVSLDGDWRSGPGQQWLFALDHRDDRLDSSDLPAGTAGRHDTGAALGYLWQQGDFDAQAHLRHDRDSDFGGATTGSLGLGYRLTHTLKLVALAGNAFRAPTLDENSSTYGPLSQTGGQSLRPETGHNVEAGLHYDADGVQASVTVYRNRVNELINFQPSTQCLDHSGGCYVNVDRARFQGLSLKGETTWAGVDWSGTFDLQTPRNLATGRLLARRARHFGTLHAQVPWQRWSLGAGLVFTGKRYDDAANQTPLGAYTLVDFDASCALSHDLKLQLNLDNAFNRVYQTAAGYAQAPRTAMVGLRWQPSL